MPVMVHEGLSGRGCIVEVRDQLLQETNQVLF